MLNSNAIDLARTRYLSYIRNSFSSNGGVRLTSLSEESPYARCFAIFGFHLLQEDGALRDKADQWAASIRSDLDLARTERDAAGVRLDSDKPYLQLLAFSLSALAVLNRLDAYPLDDHVEPLLSRDIGADLERAGALRGDARSGNQAMFMAVLWLYARDWLHIDDEGRLALWQHMHVESMNDFGCWGHARSMSHLQFQNGYHQYEILEYLEAEVPGWDALADHVASLADFEGHFSPYPGGGGCYDYDAVFLITGAGESARQRHCDLLLRLGSSLLNEQNSDGGFCESHRVRPRSLSNMMRTVAHVYASKGRARVERIRHGVSLLRPCHDRITTHWSRYSRRWNESDLWDSWFRMLTLARIEVALDPLAAARWGFIDFPGIGYHPLLANKTKETI